MDPRDLKHLTYVTIHAEDEILLITHGDGLHMELDDTVVGLYLPNVGLVQVALSQVLEKIWKRQNVLIFTELRRVLRVLA